MNGICEKILQDVMPVFFLIALAKILSLFAKQFTHQEVKVFGI
jgi:hypothetical protein